MEKLPEVLLSVHGVHHRDGSVRWTAALGERWCSRGVWCKRVLRYVPLEVSGSATIDDAWEEAKRVTGGRTDG